MKIWSENPSNFFLQVLSLELIFSISKVINIGGKILVYTGHYDNWLLKKEKNVFFVEIEVYGKNVLFSNICWNTKVNFINLSECFYFCSHFYTLFQWVIMFYRMKWMNQRGKFNLKKKQEHSIKGAGGMELASDYKLAVSCFSSNHVNFPPIRVGMCYSRSSMKKNR